MAHDPNKTYPTDTPEWKMVLFFILPTLFIILVVTSFFMWKRMRHTRRRALAEQAEWAAFEEQGDADLDNRPVRRTKTLPGSSVPMQNQMPAAVPNGSPGSQRFVNKARDNSSSRFVKARPTHELAAQRFGADASYKMGEVPVVEDASQIRPPSNSMGDAKRDWHQVKREIAVPGRTRSPAQRDRVPRPDA